jgi:hypothetical protein
MKTISSAFDTITPGPSDYRGKRPIQIIINSEWELLGADKSCYDDNSPKVIFNSRGIVLEPI